MVFVPLMSVCSFLASLAKRQTGGPLKKAFLVVSLSTNPQRAISAPSKKVRVPSASEGRGCSNWLWSPISHGASPPPAALPRRWSPRRAPTCGRAPRIRENAADGAGQIGGSTPWKPWQPQARKAQNTGRADAKCNFGLKAEVFKSGLVPELKHQKPSVH